ncbi:DUF7666 domain-containing protein [Clostridium sporogenes]|uniref:DUF7666 domain-containing protein n=1 Tax=Clostridium sporogenes TaxID=1509 RepID=UPI0013C86BCC|nr:hypothetical protein [Clostridium sporogenes]NFQ34608.1 hypothetical protein [Clostridium sporogenes]
MIKSYKGFDKDLKCRGMQYEVGKTFEEKEADLCRRGLHSCEYPLDVFRYYAPADSRYCETVADGDIDKEDSSDSKIASTKLHIEAEIGLKGIIEAGVKFVMDRVNFKDRKESNDKDRSAATNTGDYSAATNTGDYSAATNTGYRSAATNTGYRSAATNTGYRSAATNTGDYSAATNTGDYSAATNTGDYSAATNTGDQSAATNTGDYSAAIVEGSESIAIATGIGSKAKGALGCWIVATEWIQNEEYDWHIKEVKAAKVDGENIKENTFYILEDSEFKEV